MLNSEIEKTLQAKYKQLVAYLDETSLRMWAAVEALSWGHGGITSVARATGLSRTTIHAGIAELAQSESAEFSVEDYGAVRRKGGGRKPITESDPTLLDDLESLVDPVTRGDPQSPLRWTTKSTTKLAQQLQVMGHQVSQRTVCKMLASVGLQLTSKPQN